MLHTVNDRRISFIILQCINFIIKKTLDNKFCSIALTIRQHSKHFASPTSGSNNQ